MLVKDIMNQFVIVCTEDTPLAQVFELMDEGQTDHVSIVESRAHRKPLGIITEHDICFQILTRGRNPRGMTAANVMNTNIVKADHYMGVSECAKLLEESGLKRVFVVDGNGNLCGSVSDAELGSIVSSEPNTDFKNQPLFVNYQLSIADRIF